MTWVLRNPTPKPAGRGFAGITFDAGRGQTVLYGGGDATATPKTGTWTYQTNAIAALQPIGTGCAGTGGFPRARRARRRVCRLCTDRRR